MKLKNLPFALALTVAAVLVVGCGDNNSDGLSAADRAWVRQQRILQQYGISGTVTSTTTATQTVTITNSTTVVVH